jgi:UDP-2,3-diacylglucosamine pyrophosphatase LpxH
MVQGLNRSITLVLAGDTIDAPEWPLSKDDLAALDAVRLRASHEQVIWIEGNHDVGYRPVAPGNIQFVKSYTIGKRLFISHGDTFDTVMPRNRWFIKSFRFFHKLRLQLGADPVHVADYAKKFQILYNFLRRKVMHCAVEQGNEQNFGAVACGHVHFAEDTLCEGIRYINLGAWTESPCHCLLVDEEKMKLTTVEDAMQDSAWFASESELVK